MSVTEKEAMIAQVDAALESVRPHLAADGGNVEVVDITDDNIVKVKWLGNCQNCSMSYMTMKAGLEQTIKGRMPHISGVEAINGM
ncbi:MAG: NifU family protein [Lewinella sp.]|jgi:Fe-S cluster biogenesis protein NfuA|uniref:NifU family protein n=1 Tax=Lewinella sp. TaxID=2004506 RepID=UPI003D6AE38E